MALMIPTNMAYGFMAAYFPLVVTELVEKDVGEVDVGWLYSIAGITAALLALAYGAMAEVLGDRHGRAIVMCVGAISFSGVCIIFILAKDPSHFTLLEMMVIFLLYGSGQAVWQGTCMALFSEYWTFEPTDAFANLKFHSGLSTAIAFYMLPAVPGLRWRSFVCLTTVVLGVATYIPCHRVHIALRSDELSITPSVPSLQTDWIQENSPMDKAALLSGWHKHENNATDKTRALPTGKLDDDIVG